MYARFHGMAFSCTLELPTLSLAAYILKNQAFTPEYAHPDLLSPSSVSDPKDGSAQFLAAATRGAKKGLSFPEST